jgi:hypothetical protein
MPLSPTEYYVMNSTLIPTESHETRCIQQRPHIRNTDTREQNSRTTHKLKSIQCYYTFLKKPREIFLMSYYDSFCILTDHFPAHMHGPVSYTIGLTQTERHDVNRANWRCPTPSSSYRTNWRYPDARRLRMESQIPRLRMIYGLLLDNSVSLTLLWNHRYRRLDYIWSCGQ